MKKEMNEEIKFNKKIILKRIFFLIILIMTCFVIFSFSSEDAEQSTQKSTGITKFIVEIISKIKLMNEDTKIYYIHKIDPIIRKTAHFTIYAVVGFSAMGFISTFNIKNKLKIITSFGIGLTYAIADEIHQTFIPGRNGNIIDVGIDALGVITGILALIILVSWIEKTNYFKNINNNLYK